MFEIGNSLRDARTRQGLEVTDLEAQTKIRAKYLRALEAEQFEQIPGDSYVRGFLRLYAERLGLDGQLYVDEYNTRFADVDEPVFAAGARRRAGGGRAAESRAVLVALAGIVIVTALVIAAWRFGTGNEEADGGQGTSPVGAPVETVQTTGETQAVVQVTLIVSAVGGASRVEVRQRSGAGELEFEGTLRDGETSPPFRGERLWIAVSKPQNVSISLDGSEVETPRASGEGVFIATVDGLRAAGTP